jgi:beta-lactamase class A
MNARSGTNWKIVVIAALLAAASARPSHAQTALKSNGDVGDKMEIMWQKLDSQVKQADQELDGVMGVAIEDLTTGQTYFLHGDDIFAQASSIKIAVLAELYRQDQLAAQGQPGNARLTDLYTVQASDIVPDSDIMSGLTPGLTRITNRDLATMMIAVSDNAATNVLIDRLGMDKVNALLTGLGLQHTQLRRKMMDLGAAAEGRENISTPREMMTLLEAIYKEKVLDATHTQEFWKMLGTHKDSWIPRLLPDDVRVAEKPGALEGVRNDSGIIFAQGRPFLLCVMTSYLRSERQGEETIGSVARAAYLMFDRLGRASEYGRVISERNSSPPK